MNEQELIKFWTWCGFTYHSNNNCVPHWEKPDSSLFSLKSNPKITLDNLYRYAIPKLQDKGYQIDIVCFEHKGFSVAILDVCKDTNILVEIRSDNLVEALFNAILKVIDKETK
jgi:hypothetical protein